MIKHVKSMAPYTWPAYRSCEKNTACTSHECDALTDAEVRRSADK